MNAGAEGIIVGFTEIGLLIRQEDSAVPLFDTTVTHARGAVDRALECSWDSWPTASLWCISVC